MQNSWCKNVACGLKQAANQNNLCFTAHQAIMAGYSSVKSSKPQVSRRCFGTWSPQVTGLSGTCESRPGDPNLAQFNALDLSHMKELIVHKSSSGKHPNLEAGSDQRKVQEESRNLQQQESSGRSHKRTTSNHLR